MEYLLKHSKDQIRNFSQNGTLFIQQDNPTKFELFLHELGAVGLIPVGLKEELLSVGCKQN